jgi:hypothetical protein
VAKKVYERLKLLGLILVLGWASWYVVQFVLHPAPVRYEDVALIVTQNRLIPPEIRLRGDRPVRLFVANVSPVEKVELQIAADPPVITQVERGKSTGVVLSRKVVRRLDGTKLAVNGLPLESVFRVGPSASTESAAPDVAVVMCDQCAAPRAITLKRGRPVTLWVAKTASEVGYDHFVCDELGISADVTDGEVTEVQLKPEKCGQFIFTGTVTPDSKVVVQVED